MVIPELLLPVIKKNGYSWSEEEIADFLEELKSAKCIVGEPPKKGWKNIPEKVAEDLQRRIRQAEKKYYLRRSPRLVFRFSRSYCYIDALAEDFERPKNPVVHICRLQYFGDAERGWGFAKYSYGSKRYERSFYSNGDYLGTPEEAFWMSLESLRRQSKWGEDVPAYQASEPPPDPGLSTP